MNNEKERREGTGIVAGERNVSTHLLSVNDAIGKVGWLEGLVVRRA